MYKIILIRHGQSQWNKENRFTGWVDVDLTEQGVSEAHTAGRSLREAGFTFDLAFTSLLKRAVRTLDIVLEELDEKGIEIRKSWRLNERHYGALTGLNKAETASEFGEKQVELWRRGYDTAIPPMKPDSQYFFANDSLYKDLDKKDIPLSENLKDVVTRVLPYWNNEIVPEIKSGKKIIIAASGNSLRALVKHLDNMSDTDIVGLNIPTGIPLVYELDADMKPISKHYLADEAVLEQAMETVKNQGKVK
ncbi:MAG: 2,3-diphosphoglycerate-dependent phosphoglycerate mutase [Candidatus Paceibacterota bacterium]|jgi:2,3-bisphosphoglycerate-dependent phosphoglycerate mutase